jgi:YebC/PmpR family DNA-binding regulatory protein
VVRFIGDILVDLWIIRALFFFGGFLRCIIAFGMSGHSHYATIKRQKEVKDAARGNLFSKLARAITIAAKAGGGPDPNSNFKLRVVMDAARAANMPKENIERAISKASGPETLEEVTYEGYGPSGIAVVVEAATDNRNRTGQEIKNIFERGGGSLAGPGAVSFNFEQKGLLLVEKKEDPQAQMLSMIDLGVEDVEETTDAIEVYVATDKLAEARQKLIEAGLNVTSAELYLKPKNLQPVTDPKEASRVLSFLDSLEQQADVQKVNANVDIPDNVVAQANV